MRKWFSLLILIGAFFAGWRFGEAKPASCLKAGKDFPIKERKSFVFLVYAHNDADWTKRSLRSILEQEYDYYRIVFIDDGSTDDTFDVAQSFIVENNQELRTYFIRNEERLGKPLCLHQAIQGILDQEIAIPMLAKNWLSQSGALTRMNAFFQNPDIWGIKASSILFPTFDAISSEIEGAYGVVLKELSPSSLEKGFLTSIPSRRIRNTSEILGVQNQAALTINE